jgi:hypothetical protein
MSKKSLLDSKKKKKKPLILKANDVDNPFSEYVSPKLINRLANEENETTLRYGALKLKASEIILDFCFELLEDAEDEEDFKIGISIAIVAWNIAQAGEENRKEAIMMLKKEKHLKKEDIQLIMELVEYKNTEFKEYNFFIEDFEVEINDNGDLTLSVASTQL